MAWLDTRFTEISSNLNIKGSRAFASRTKKMQSTSKVKKKAAILAAIKKTVTQLKAKNKPRQLLEASLLEGVDEDSFPDSPTPNNKTVDIVYILSSTGTTFALCIPI